MNGYAVFLLVIGIAVSEVESNPGSDSNASRTLIHLLDYLAQDYGGAVSGGLVIDSTEYEEQKEFASKAVRIHSKLPGLPDVAATGAQVARLEKMIESKADADSVGFQARALRQSILSASGLATSPLEWPNQIRGKERFAQNCAVCHGPGGRGDGPGGAALQPPPANFHDRERMSQLSPFQVFNTIRLGVEGTGMPAFKEWPDRDLWDLAFYVLSLRYEVDSAWKEPQPAGTVSINLHRLSVSSDNELKALLGSDGDTSIIAALRLRSGEPGPSAFRFLDAAEEKLDEAVAEYRAGHVDKADNAALMAYLEGVEPLEPRLRALNPELVPKLERVMGAVRRSIQSRESTGKLEADVESAKVVLLKARDSLGGKSIPPWAAFLMAAGILLREGFEALLIILAILGVVRAAGSPRAAWYVHGGWISAVLAGFLAWFFSGWLVRLSGAGRELTEGLGSLIAVAVLLYMGFWMHSKTEIRRWRAFVDEKIKDLLKRRNLLALGAFSFLVSFREAMETVLFLSALNVEGSGGGKPILLGVLVALGVTLLVAWSFLKASRKIPLRLFFLVSSFMMGVLAIILAGKGLHALQEAGILKATLMPLDFGIDLIGFYPTYETLMAQIITFFVAFLLLFPKECSRMRMPGSQGDS